MLFEAPAPTETPAELTGAPTAAAAARADTMLRTNRFTFHSNPWLNLHHLLFQWADVRSKQSAPIAEETDLARLSPSERAALERAIGFYQKTMIQGDLFDTLLVAFKAQLIGLDIDQADAVRTLPEPAAQAP